MLDAWAQQNEDPSLAVKDTDGRYLRLKPAIFMGFVDDQLRAGGQYIAEVTRVKNKKVYDEKSTFSTSNMMIACIAKDLAPATMEYVEALYNDNVS